MTEICNDNRFVLIEKYKNELLENTNIATSKEEMDVIDNILFRFWQMGWLDNLEQFDYQKEEIKYLNAEIERLRDEVSKARRKALLEAKSKFAGHSDYHGDTILCKLICMAEGKEVGVAKPLDKSEIK